MAVDLLPTSPVAPALVRHDLPRRYGYRIDVDIAGTAFGITVNVTEGRLVEIDIDHAPHGTFGNGLTSAVSLLASAALQHGMAIEEFVNSFRGVRFEPLGITDDPEIRHTTSVMDYLARRIESDFL